MTWLEDTVRRKTDEELGQMLARAAEYPQPTQEAVRAELARRHPALAAPVAVDMQPVQPPHALPETSTARSTKSQNDEQWTLAIGSGLIVGIALAVVREGQFGGGGFMAVAFLYGWLILNFGLPIAQRVTATILALSIGFYGPVLARAAFAP